MKAGTAQHAPLPNPTPRRSKVPDAHASRVYIMFSTVENPADTAVNNKSDTWP